MATRSGEVNGALGAPATSGVWWRTGQGIVALVALGKLLLHLVPAALLPYGPFIDELYFMACGEHLAWGYVDMPPLTAVQAWLTRHLLGDSLVAMHFLPALAGAGLVLLLGAFVRRLGGGRWAQGLAAFAVATSPLGLAFTSYLSMNALEPLIWTSCAYLLVRMIQTRDTRLWVPFGVLAGVGLLNKHTMLMFGFALVVSLLLTAERRLMASVWFVAGGALVVLIVLPNLLWEIEHGFPHLEMLANIRRNGRDVQLNPLVFLALQLLLENLLAAPLWLAGLWRTLVAREERRFRFVGLAFVATFAILLAMHGRVHYLHPAFPMLFAFGAPAVERWLAARQSAWLRPAYAGLVAAWAAVLAPLMAPMLPPAVTIAWQNALPLGGLRFENRPTGPIHQLLADRFGWPEMVAAVARAYHALPPEEQARCAIYGNDYGQAGAIDLYGPRYGLPKSIGGHLTYWYWGPRGYTGEVCLVLGDDGETLKRLFSQVEAVAEVGHPLAMRQEHFSVFLCRHPKGWTFDAIWPRLKTWD